MHLTYATYSTSVCVAERDSLHGYGMLPIPSMLGARTAALVAV